MLKIPLVLCFAILLITCNSRKPSNNKPAPIFIEINKKFNVDEMRLSEFVTHIELVKLQTTEKSLIGNITNIEYYNNQYYISDRFITQKVMMFDKEGRYIKTISNIGKGPGEYGSIDYITIDKHNDEFIIVDAQNRKLLIYDLKGLFIKEILLDYLVCSIHASDNEYFLYLYDTDKELFNLIILDKNTLKVKGKHFEKNPALDGFVNSNTFFTYRDNLLFSYSLSNIVYDITTIVDNETKVRYSIGLHNLQQEFRNQVEIMQFMEKNNHYYFPFLIHETENFLIFSFLEGKTSQYGIFDKQSQNFVYSKNVINDINSLPYKQPIGNKGINQLISVVDPYEIDESIMSNFDSENPLLLICHFK